MDIAIPLGKDKFNYRELRYTLRSIEKNLSGYLDIYIIGEKPAWLTGVIHIPFKDVPHRKAYSIFRKMYHAAELENVSQKFISWADDTYLLEPLDVSGIKDWYNSTLEYWSNRNINSLYRNIIKNTHKVFPEGLFYNVHAPCVYDKDRFQALNVYNWQAKEYLIKSMYFNSGESNPVEMKDPKRHTGLFHSTNGMHSEAERFLRNLFPNPSRYEADNKANAKATSGMAEATG